MKNLEESFEVKMMFALWGNPIVKNQTLVQQIGATQILKLLLESVGKSYEKVKREVENGEVSPSDIAEEIKNKGNSTLKVGDRSFEVKFSQKSKTGKPIVDEICLEVMSGSGKEGGKYKVPDMLRKNLTTYNIIADGKDTIKSKVSSQYKILMDNGIGPRSKENIQEDLHEMFATGTVVAMKKSMLIYPCKESEYLYIGVEMYKEDAMSAVATIKRTKGEKLQEEGSQRKIGVFAIRKGQRANAEIKAHATHFISPIKSPIEESIEFFVDDNGLLIGLPKKEKLYKTKEEAEESLKGNKTNLSKQYEIGSIGGQEPLKRKFLGTSRTGGDNNISKGVPTASFADVLKENYLDVSFDENAGKNTLVLKYYKGNSSRLNEGDVTRLIVMRDSEDNGRYKCYVSWYNELDTVFGVDKRHGEADMLNEKEVTCTIDLELLRTNADYCYAVMHELCDEKRVRECIERGSTDIGFVSENGREYITGRSAITNVQINVGNMKKAKSQMITGLTHVEGHIALDRMNATIKKGTEAGKQDEAVLLKIHPQIPEFKILVVSDAVQKSERGTGEKISHFVVEEISMWFENLSKDYYTDMNKLKEALSKKITQISKQAAQNWERESGATLVCAIVGKEKTIIANVGDSRAYGVKDGKLTQFTSDQSEIQDAYDKGEIIKDDMRFWKETDDLYHVIGIRPDSRPRFNIVDNIQYNKLLLLSRHGHRYISDKDIELITKCTSIDELSGKLVKVASSSKAIVREELRDDRRFYNEIYGGDKNIAAAVYGNDEEER